MINQDLRVAVCSRSFSMNPILREELLLKFPKTKFNESGTTLSGDALAAFLADADAAIIALEKVDENLLQKIPNLKIIGKYGVGVNNIDFHALDRHGVRFGWTKGVNKRSVAELTLGFSLSLSRTICAHTANLKKGSWLPSTGLELSSLTFGVLGCGHVGKEVVKLLSVFGTRILAYDIADLSEFYSSYGVKAVSKEELLSTCDIVSLHLPLTPDTKNFIGNGELRLMKSSSYLINTARGGLVDENSLYEQLKTKKLAGAAFDVFLEEPAKENKLLELDNFYSTPHIGGSTETSILAMGRSAIVGLYDNKDAKNYFNSY